MDNQQVEQWLEQARSGALAWSELAERLLRLEHAGDAAHRPDVDRQRRCGFPEVIYGPGKSPEAIASIAARLLSAEPRPAEVLVTRVDPETAAAVQPMVAHARYHASGRTLRISLQPIGEVAASPWSGRPAQAEAGVDQQRRQVPLGPTSDGEQPAETVLVVTAGSTDLPVASEALETLRWMGFDAGLITDVGVAGPYRLLPHLERLRQASVLVVVAGMEGALASVVGGLVACPIIAVPTSVGYGANLAGITTLLSMISSCAAGVTVVNIDAGFKGGYVAGLIARQGRSASRAI